MKARRRLGVGSLLSILMGASLAIVLTPSEARTQTAPSASQYGIEETRSCPSGPEGGRQVNSVDDGVCAAADNTSQGTDAVNNALNDRASSTGATSAQPGSASASDATASSEAGTPSSASPPSTDDDTVDGDTVDGDTADGEIAGGSEQGPGSISELPETGGASLTMLWFGVLLVTVGLTMRRISRW